MIGPLMVAMLATAMLVSCAVWLESGARTPIGSDSAPMLVPVVASFAGTTLLIVVLIVASMFGAALRQRAEEFALLRLTGATPQQIRSLVTAEVLVVFAVAAPLGVALGHVGANALTPALRSSGVIAEGFAASHSPFAALGSLLVLVPSALISGRLAARRVATGVAAQSLVETSVEDHTVPRTRLRVALVFLCLGVLAATAPFGFGGLMGVASGASAAFLLITAAALGAPTLIRGIAQKATLVLSRHRSGLSLIVATNARGHGKRLTTAIIPLALVIAMGTIQTSSDAIVSTAATEQYADSLKADVVITGAAIDTHDMLTRVQAVEGVTTAASSTLVPASVRTDDDDDLPFLERLLWEPTVIRVVNGDISALVDPQVRSGSLDGLDDPNTVAVSADLLFATGKGIGSTLAVRFSGQDEVTARIVAIYERGLGLGDIMTSADLSGMRTEDVQTEVFAITEEGFAATDLVDELPTTGWRVQTGTQHLEAVSSSAQSQSDLSRILILVLVSFIAVAALNTLMMLSGARHPELALLRTIGTSRRQVLAILGIEALLVALSAWAIGVLTVVPSIIASSWGLLGRVLIVVDWPVFLTLSGVLVFIAYVGGLLPAVVAFSRRRTR